MGALLDQVDHIRDEIAALERGMGHIPTVTSRFSDYLNGRGFRAGGQRSHFDDTWALRWRRQSKWNGLTAAGGAVDELPTARSGRIGMRCYPVLRRARRNSLPGQFYNG